MTSEGIERVLTATHHAHPSNNQSGAIMQRRDFVSLASGTLIASVLQPNATASSGGAFNAAAFHKARRFASTRFGRIAYVDRGGGDAVLFLHGFPLNGFQWRDAIDQLSGQRRCIAPDFLGLGYTQVAAGQGVAPLDQVAMLVALLDELNVRRADVIASDSGGAVAQLFVARHPARVRTLLLTNCDAEFDYPLAALAPIIELSRAGTFADDMLGIWAADTTLARSAQGIGGMCYSNAEHPTDEAIDTYFTPILSTADAKHLVHAYALALEANPLAGIEASLKLCRIPTRIVWGMADTIFSAESPDYLARTFGNSHGVRKLAGARLFWPEERPDVIVEEAKALWEEARDS